MRFEFAYRRYRLPLRVAVRTAHGVWREREGVMVRLTNAEGETAYGEAAPIAWFGTETADEVEGACRDIGAEIDAEQIDRLPGNPGCLRNALHEARAQLNEREEGRRIARGERTDTNAAKEKPAPLPVAALLSAGKAALEAIPSKAEIGFRVFKWKVGVGDIADELVLLDDVCAALPERAKLRLDANGAWDRRRAERWLERCAERPVEFVEQPVAANARGAEDLLLGLAQDYPTRIALDESLVGEADLERWLAAGWPGVLVIKPALLGNPTEALRRLEQARADVVFSSALETAVGARAALAHAFRWQGGRRAIGFGVWPLFEDTRFDGPAAAPFVRWEDVERIDGEAIWNVLS